MTTLPGSPSEETPIPRFQLTNLSVRLLTAAVVLPIVVIISLTGGWLFAIACGVIALLGMIELHGIAYAWAKRHGHLDLVSFLGAAGFGLVYIGIPTLMLISMRQMPNGMVWIALVYALTWGTDTFAYIGGRLWGKTPLAPRISPKKTREGAIAGVIGSFFASMLVLIVAGRFDPVFLLLLSIAPAAAIIGDLFESAIKRTAEIKDSHLAGFNIFPGHGGVLDRVDSLIFVSALTFIFLQLVQTGVAL